MFEFLNPLFLVGVASAAIPLLIHLSRSRRTKKIQFSTTRFLTDQFLRSYRMSRLKEILLLVCRMALFALFAIALAQPLFLPPGQSFILGQSRCLVLVIDNSASMGYIEDGQTMLQRAQAAAKDLLEGLGAGDTATIVLAGRKQSGPDVLFPEPTTELGDVRQAVEGLSVKTLGTDLTGAVDRAEIIARKSPAKSREIYVLSDLQDSGWELADSDRASAAPSDVLLFFVRTRPTAPENLAVTAVQYAASRPLVGIPFSIRPHVRNQGEQLQRCDVSLYVDGKKVGEQPLEKLAGGRWGVPRFYHAFATPGWHTGHVEVTDQALAADNRRYFAFQVLDSVKLLVVNGAPSEVPRLDEAFFLKAALTAAAEGLSPIHIDEVNVPNLSGKSLDGYPLVILANVESVSPELVEKLEQYVDAGGSLWFFLGDQANVNFYNQSLAAPTRLHGGLLPATLSRLEGDPAGKDDFAFIGPVETDHVALAAFSDPNFANLAGVTFKALWGLEPGDSAVLMRTNAGAPLLCEKPFGKGRVLLFASSCDRDWSNFPVRPAFLPWMYRLVGYLAQVPLDGQGFHETGEQISLPMSAVEGLTAQLVQKPDESLGTVTSSSNPSAPLVFRDTAETGIYTVITPGMPEKGGSSEKAGQQEKGPRFAVNLESYESDLTYLDDVLAERESANAAASRDEKVAAGFRELLQGRPMVHYVSDPARIRDMSLDARRGFKLWDMLLSMVLVIALFEPWLANRISMRHYLRAGNSSQPVGAAPTGRMTRFSHTPRPSSATQETSAGS